MKSTLSVFVLITSFVLNSFAQAAEVKGPSVTVSSFVSDKYLGFGTGNLLSRDPVIQSGVNVLFENGIFVDLWNSRSLRGKWDNGSLGNEIDYQLGWKGNLATNLHLAAGVTYFDEPKAFRFGAGDVLYTHAFLTKEFKHLSVTAGYENFTTMPKSGFQGGHLLSLGVGKSLSLWDGKVSLQASAAGVYDTATLGSGKGFLLRGNVGANWNLTKRLTWTVLSANWYVPLVSDKRETAVVASTGVIFKLR